MLVRDLIRGSTWTPPRRKSEPRLSVLMPIFRRNSDGMLSRAISSVLGQTLDDLELIIVDDASTDGSLDTALAFHSHDDRVGLITHPENIGLPAISEFEAFLKSRGRFISFAFDDYVFEPKGLEALVKTDVPAVHGISKFQINSSVVEEFGRGEQEYSYLEFYNFIANASVVLRRDVIDEVGLYDPHIIASRLCDWDLWRRVHRKYRWKAIPVIVGTEYGVSRPESLGNTYPSFVSAAREHFSSNRDAALRAETFAEYDVWQVPRLASVNLSCAVEATQTFFRSRSWVGPEENNVDRKRRPILGILGSKDASTHLFLDGLIESENVTVVFLRMDGDQTSLRDEISECDALIVVRLVVGEVARAATQAAIDLRVPVYCLIDDNFVVLSGEYDEYKEYNESAMRAALGVYDRVFVGSEALRAYFEAMEIADNCVVVPSVYSPTRVVKADRLGGGAKTAVLTVAFVGSGARLVEFQTAVVPAIRRLASERPVRLVVSKGALGTIKLTGVETVEIQRTGYFDGFLEMWGEYHPDIIVHPRARTKNVDYKASNVLLVAAYLGSGIIVEDEPAFSGHRGRVDAVRTVGAGGWYEHIRALAEMPEYARKHSVRAYCEATFRYEAHANPISLAISEIKPMSATDMWVRLRTQLHGRRVALGGIGDSRAMRVALRLRRLAERVRTFPLVGPLLFSIGKSLTR